jgi:hypothetical protein
VLIIKKDLPSRTKVITWKPLCLQTDDDNAGLTLEGDSGEEVALRVIGLDMTENRIFTLCRMIT